MNPVWIIAKKRDGGELSHDEIGYFITGFVNGDIANYQMSALAMAIFLKGMSTEETASLTDHMLASGATFSWPAAGLPKVDKHSTGGIGDKVSLPLAAILACCDLAIPMISGRGLGSTGGTLDKLDSIPGFRTDLTMDEMKHVVEEVGCVISGATPDLVPADRELYSLRDVTATVPSIPLITASIMSKKLAEGLDALVLDVKFGSGAFMKTEELARQLAESLVNTGKRMGVSTTALLTDMNQPLGRMVGNAIEVNESVDALEGRGATDLMEVTYALGAELLTSTQRCDSLEQAQAKLAECIGSGAAREKFSQMVTAQGGELDAPRAVAPKSEVTAPKSGFVSAMDAEQLGQAVIAMKGGRQKLGDSLDYSTGFEMLVRLGDQVETGQPVAHLFATAETQEAGHEKLLSAIQIEDTKPEVGSLILERIE